ncbi:hypothetical protein [Microcoleus sp. CAWBG58]|uniref:hypothetical protein n=1 Tax=Microcoleus sp. CAWBG58 TaxID=2841651 RepID=UPI0025EC0204|nr:hypothetical protein [Microcoleus sp. CAWBG58]
MIRPIAPDDTTALIALAEATGLFGPHETEELALMLADHFGGETNSQDIWITDDDGGLVGRVCCAGTNDRWDAVVASPVQKPGIPVQSPESIRLRLVLRSPFSLQKRRSPFSLQKRRCLWRALPSHFLHPQKAIALL